MARKKKIEEPVNEEFKAEELSDELKERIDEVMDVVGTQTTSGNVEPVSTPVEIKTVDMERLVTLKKLKDEAMDEIHRCSAYVFSGRDKAFGRVFELSRTEWCDYYIALEYCEKKPDSPIPKQPSRQSEPN